jgi:hypothetical protein
VLKSPLVTAEFAPLAVCQHVKSLHRPGCEYSPVQVKLEPPTSGILRTSVVPVVHKVTHRGAVEAFECEAFSIEGFLL